ncbi:MAG: hypothetical protein QXW80_05355 [Candidatus Micrarchaeia archaeon]
MENKMEKISKKIRLGKKLSIAFILLALILSPLTYAQNQFVINFGTLPSGNCTYNSQCTSNLCADGQCVACTADKNCSSNLCENGICISCSSDSQCSRSTNYCLNGVCTACLSDLSCSTGLCLNGVCTTCSNDIQCAATGYPCISGKCQPCTSDDQCSVGICQAGGRCKSCSEIGCPNNWICNADTGKCSCRSNGQSCTSGLECCTGTCRAGSCALCILNQECQSGQVCLNGFCVPESEAQPSQLPPVPTTTSGGRKSSSSDYQQAISIQREVEREAAAPFIYSIFGVSKTKIQASATCIKGALCSTTADCCGAECVNGQCLCAKGACITSGECCTGYCENGICRNPPVMSLFIAEALNKPITSQFACNGLIEECDPTETQCISICNGLTGLLALVSIGFGFFVWREFNHPVPGLVGVFVPVLIGLITYPFVGIIIGIIMLGLMLARQ